jgi:hypothetical protein
VLAHVIRSEGVDPEAFVISATSEGPSRRKT